MGKRRKQDVSYTQEALVDMAQDIKCSRVSAEDGKLPDLEVDLMGLASLVQELPKKDREVVEKYWGLIPDTPAFKYRFLTAKAGKSRTPDLASVRMLEHINRIKDSFYRIENLYCYDNEAHRLIDNIAKKIDKTDAANVSDLDAIRYLLILVIFIAGGPRFVFEQESSKIDLEVEKNRHFDEYATLEAIWKETTHALADHSIKLRLIMNLVEMFDYKDAIAIRKYVRLPVTAEEQSIETEELKSEKSIRLMKERLFLDGPWDVSTTFIYGEPGKKPINLRKLGRHLEVLSRDWNKIEKYNQKEYLLVFTSAGESAMPIYTIEGKSFTDVYELMYLYINQRYL